MYWTQGIDAIATITELRGNTTALLDQVRIEGRAVLIQKNNDPYAVLLDWETYNELVGASERAKDREAAVHRGEKTAPSGSKKAS